MWATVPLDNATPRDDGADFVDDDHIDHNGGAGGEGDRTAGIVRRAKRSPEWTVRAGRNGPNCADTAGRVYRKLQLGTCGVRRQVHTEGCGHHRLSRWRMAGTVPGVRE